MMLKLSSNELNVGRLEPQEKHLLMLFQLALVAASWVLFLCIPLFKQVI
jgi:hypothetical protein